MKWFANLQVRFKLLVSFIFVIIFVVALTVVAIFTVNRMDSSYSYLLDYPEKRLENMMGLNTYSSDMRRSATAITLNFADPKLVDSYWNQFQQAYTAAIENIDSYIANSNADTVRDPAIIKENNAIAADMKAQLATYKQYAAEAVDFARAGDLDATNASFLAGVPMITAVVNATGGLITKAENYVAEVSAANSREKVVSDRIFIILSAFIVALSIFIALFVANSISRPLVIMSAFLNKAGSKGDIALEPADITNIEKFSRNKDEIGQCVGSCSNFVKRLMEVSGSLEAVSNGDLTVDMQLLSEKDVMGISLQKMISQLNGMFAQINTATGQVSSGSKQIADGAQSLALGSTEQAAAIEQLSASIGDMASKTKENAGMAERAASLGNTIKANAEKGSQQMSQMMGAVQDINEASQSINKVIKVIDDIAFQTNILALNAAVEAARAGQHGKGFAVVAEEVRNLAGKSAEAAKDTGSLIENSIEKANFGARIAGETAQSLAEIVSGINESSQIVNDIAHSSEEQAEAITQINVSIDQVAQVVQQNSASAEQSAAASQELNGQSNALEELISHFRLKNDALPPALARSGAKSLPPAEEGVGFGKY